MVIGDLVAPVVALSSVHDYIARWWAGGQVQVVPCHRLVFMDLWGVKELVEQAQRPTTSSLLSSSTKCAGPLEVLAVPQTADRSGPFL